MGITNEYDIPALITGARDQSSYHYVDLMFPAYSADQLRSILEYRVEQAFYPNSLNTEVISLSAALAAQRNGDARYALDLLSTAADLCEEEGRTTVTEDDVRRAQRLAEVSLIRREVVRLSLHQKVLLACTAKKRDNLRPRRIESLTTARSSAKTARFSNYFIQRAFLSVDFTNGRPCDRRNE